MAETSKDKPKVEKIEDKNTIYTDFKKLLSTMEKSAALKDLKSLTLLINQINKYRLGFTSQDFAFVSEILLGNRIRFSSVLPLEGTEKDQLFVQFNFNTKNISKFQNEVKEIFYFNYLLMILYTIDNKKHDEAFTLLTDILTFLNQASQTFWHIKSLAYYYYALEAERLGKYALVMPDLQHAYRQSCLDMNNESQVTLINCILRYFIINNSYEQARNFLSKIKYIENTSMYQDARHLYYLGRINSVQMNYSEAFANLTNCLRKAPDQNEGFRVEVEKLLLIVELLMGEIPDLTKYHKLKQIGPYLFLLKAVKRGNLQEFKNTIEKYKESFFKDKNYNLIQRLRLIVIKVGLRKINLSYSRISIKDIAEKLNLGSEKETELIIMKAIRDGVFLAKINHEEGIVKSEEITDVYSTFEPQKAFHRRINFLNHIFNESKKEIKYPENKNKNKATELTEEEDLGFEGQFLDL